MAPAAEHTREAEGLALAGLAEYLLETLPAGSMVCRAFFHCGEQIAGYTAWSSGYDSVGSLALMRMEKDLRRIDREGAAA